jgi:hypothetical protein
MPSTYISIGAFIVILALWGWAWTERQTRQERESELERLRAGLAEERLWRNEQTRLLDDSLIPDLGCRTQAEFDAELLDKLRLHAFPHELSRHTKVAGHAQAEENRRAAFEAELDASTWTD